MAVQGTSNLFMDRDTKLFLLEQLGRPFSIDGYTTPSKVFTSPSAPHGLQPLERVTFVNTGGLSGSGLALSAVYYVGRTSFTTTTFKLYPTLAEALSDSNPIGTSGQTSTSAGVLMAMDQVTPVSSAVVTGSAGAEILTLTVPSDHKYAANDLISINGMVNTANTSLPLNGVYNVTSVTTTTVVVNVFNFGTLSSFTPVEGSICRVAAWQIPVLKGYSMSGSTTTSEVTISEMTSTSGVSRRGRQMFNDAMNPTEWSIDTYMRPYVSSGSHYCVEEPLWANFIANNACIISGTTWEHGVTRSSTDVQYSFADSNSVRLGTFDLVFVLGAAKISGLAYGYESDTTIYRIKDAVVNEASMSFDVDGISKVSWSGLGGQITELGFFYGTGAITTGVSNGNFIANKLTSMSLTRNTTISGVSTDYVMSLTSGSITFSNGISYLTPEVLGKVNKPIGHVAGTRNINGSFTVYMDEVTGGSVDLLQHLLELAPNTITSSFAINFYIGGGANDALKGPGVQIKIPTAHLEIPTIEMEDVLSVAVNFHALPSTVGGVDEVSYIKYKGV